MDPRHDYLGKPFMRCPRDGGCMIGKDVVLGNGKIFKNILAGPNVITSVSISQKSLPGKKRKMKENKQEDNIPNGGK